MIRGSIVFDGIALMELEVNFIGGPAGTIGPSKLVGKAAFVHSSTGTTHGSTTCYQWSQNTIDRLMELRAAMEQDLAGLHFSDGGEATTRRPGLESSFNSGGIAESLQDDAGVPQG